MRRVEARNRRVKRSIHAEEFSRKMRKRMYHYQPRFYKSVFAAIDDRRAAIVGRKLVRLTKTKTSWVTVQVRGHHSEDVLFLTRSLL